MPKVTKQVGGEQRAIKTTTNHRMDTGAIAKTGNIFEDALSAGDLPDTGYKVLIFGESATGKTTLACSFPKPLYMIRPEEVEDGSRSVRSIAEVKFSPYITDPDQLVEVIEGQKKTRRYRTIVLDGVDRLQDMVVKKHMGLMDVPVQMTWGLVPQADWNRIGISIKEYLRDLLRLTEDGTYIVFTGQERLLENKESQVSVPRVTVAMTPGCIGWIHPICDYNIHTFKRVMTQEVVKKVGGKDITIQMATGKAEFCIHMGNDHPLYAIKWRTDKETSRKLPDVMVDPTYDKMEKLIQEGGK